MSTPNEQQEEEIEVLEAIYGMDEGFEITTNDANEKVVRVVVESETERKLVLDCIWGSEYPTNVPKFSLDAFSNNTIPKKNKAHVISELHEKATEFVGDASTYSVVEWLKGELDRLLIIDDNDSTNDNDDDDESAEPGVAAAVAVAADSGSDQDVETTSSTGNIPIPTPQTQTPKKQQPPHKMTKAEKRRMARLGIEGGGEAPRGHDWVDVVRHLSQIPAHRYKQRSDEKKK